MSRQTTFASLPRELSMFDTTVSEPSQSPVVKTSLFGMDSKTQSSPTPSSPPSRRRSFGMANSIEEGLKHNDLVELKLALEEIDPTGTRGVDEDQFIRIIRRALKSLTRTDEELRRWFRRIDANANGLVQWEEIGTYLLSEGQQRSLTDHRNFEYTSSGLPRHIRNRGAHCDMISRFVVNQRYSKVYTTGHDGKIKIWNADSLNYERVMYNGCRY
eukprot:PhM_4_TR16770/c0_g1_i1/m.22747